MQVLDLTIANVSLPTIAGDLGVSPDTSTWIITSFTIANGMSVPLTGWLMTRYGVVRVFLASLLIFTLASLLCGLAWNLPVLILFRIIQGAGSGPMVPGAQALMISIFPADRRSTALGIATIMTLVGPIAGPVLGGIISDNFYWGWIFLINAPVGLFVALVIWRTLGHRDTPTRKLPIDSVGLGLLVIWVSSLQTMLDLGRNADWFNSPMIVTLAAVSAVVFLAWLIWELTDEHPIVDLSLFRGRNFLLGTIGLCLAFGVFFGNILLLPLWLQTQQGYNATWAGLVVAPSGITAIVLMPFITRMMRSVDPRLIASGSLLALAAAYVMRASYTTDVGFAALALVSVVQGVGAGSFFLSLLTILLDGVPAAQLPSAIGLANFARIVVSGFAASMTTTLWDRREAFHQSHLVEAAMPAAAPFADMMHRLGMVGIRGPMADAMMQGQLVKQAYLLSTVDLYWGFALLTAGLAGLVWLTRHQPHAAAVPDVPAPAE
jgi:DHA2 family multidrug resistance protein